MLRQVFVILEEFCSNSTVHGIRYLAARKHHWIERWDWNHSHLSIKCFVTQTLNMIIKFRIWWAIAVVASLAMCSMAILSIWKKWHRQPVIVSFNDRTTSVGMIPFPAVSICTTQKYVKDKFNVNKFVDLLSDAEQSKTLFPRLSSEEYVQFKTFRFVSSNDFSLFLLKLKRQLSRCNNARLLEGSHQLE